MSPDKDQTVKDLLKLAIDFEKMFKPAKDPSRSISLLLRNAAELIKEPR